MTTVNREVLASAQMRDRIADVIRDEAKVRDKRNPGQVAAGVDPPPKSKLLRALERRVRSMPAQQAHVDHGKAAEMPADMQEIIRKVTA